jgi:HK97 family phage major capsid protein
MHPKQIIQDVLALAELYRPTWPDICASIERSGAPTCAVAEAPLKEKLKRIEHDLGEARGERVDLSKAVDDAVEKYAGAESISPDSDEFKAAEKARGALGECDERIGQLTEAQIGTLQMLGKPATGKVDTKAAGDASDPRLQWNSAELFTEEMQQKLSYLATSKGHVGTQELGEVLSKEALARSIGVPLAEGEDVTPTDIMRRGPLRAVVPQLRRVLRVLDLIPTGTMDLNSFPYVREEGSLKGKAAGVKEGLEKPQGGFTYKDDEAVARTLAEFMKIKKQALADVSALRSTIDSRLRYALELLLEAEVLAGKGNDPELDGILSATGKGLVKYKAEELTADQALRAITAVLLANAQATGIVMNPRDWQEVLIAKSIFNKGESGSGEYFGGGPFASTAQTMWGVPLIPSVAIPQGTVLAGDFTIGVQLLIREGINVLMSDSDQDDFITNRVTMLAETRAASVIWRPPAFAVTYLTKEAEEEAE